MKKKKRVKKTIDAVKRSDKPLISVCVIAKNEEKYIHQCLSSVKAIADEIIFVDTGSTDRTEEIARKYTHKIYNHPWNDSFSEARNHYLKHAKGNWIFQVDADEELVKEDIPNVLKAVQDDSIDAVIIQIVSTAYKGRSKAIHSSERIFRNNGVIHYEGRVHNRVVGMTSSKICQVRLLHYGYDILDSDIGIKSERTLLLLQKDLLDNPNNPTTHHYLSCSYLSRGMYRETIKHGLKAINLAEVQRNKDLMFLWTNYNLSLAYYKLNNLIAAKERAINALKKYPDHIDSHFMMIVISYDQKCWKELIYHTDHYLHLVDTLNSDPSRFGNLMTCSLNEEWNVHVLIGIAYVELGQAANSQKSFEKAIQSAPEPFIALRAIGIYCYNKNYMKKSLLYLEKARKLNANDETVNQLLGRISAKGETFQKEPTISCCMIVKNEEAFLERCLKSVKDYVDEIIIVDTGSRDNTVDIARKFTDRIYFHPWEGSFSKARNQALQYAGCDWIFQIDGDEELVEGSGQILRQAVFEAGEVDAILVNIISIYSGGKKTARHNFERLFRNNGVIHYESIVHNRVVGQTCAKPSKIELMHYGYNVDEKKANEKFIRTTELLKKQIRDTPDDPMPHHYLGTSYLARAMYKECVEESILAIRLAESHGNPSDIYMSTYHNAALAFFHLGEFKNVRDYSLRALKKFPEHLDSLYMMTLISTEDKQWNDVLDYGLRYLDLRDEYEKHPERTGLILNSTIKEGGKIDLLIGHAYHALKNDAGREKHYQAAYRMSEDKWQCCWNIGTFHLDHSGDLGLSRKYLDHALAEAPEEPLVWYMLAKWHGKTENEKEEKHCLSKLFELGTRDVMLLNRLASLSLSFDDLVMAHRALDDLMKIDDRNYSGLCSLGLFYRRKNSLDKAMEVLGKAIEINPQETLPWLQLGDIAMELGQYDNARMLFEHIFNSGERTLKSLLYLCEIELRQDRVAEFIYWCDLLLKELQLNRNRTLHHIEDISVILNEIYTALINDRDLSAHASRLHSLLPLSRR